MTSTDTRGSAIDAPDDDVAAFAAAVRSHLDDLPPDEVEDLVDGLEADLTERREDSDEPLGDARAYADELRAAAGLPPRDARTGREWFGGARRLRGTVSAWVRRERENPVVAAVLDFLIVLRPVWWVLRGWAAFVVTVLAGAFIPIPTTLPGWLLLAGFVTVSVQWGRGRWLPWSWLHVAKIVVSIAVVIALPFAIGKLSWTFETAAYGNSYEMDAAAGVPASGLVNVNGNPVANLFAFDCEGNPLSGVQLFDQDGEPLDIGDHGPDDEWIFGIDENGNEIAVLPSPNTTGGSGWNVFPRSYGEFTENYDVDRSTIEEPSPPFAAVQPLADAETTCAAEAGAEAGSDDEGQSTGPTDPSAPSETSAPVEPSEP